MKLFAVVAASAMMLAAPQRPEPLAAAARTLAADRIQTLQFTAAGSAFTVGQNFTPSDPWPPTPIRTWSALIDYPHAGMRIDFVRTLGPEMPRGGGVPFTGDLRQVQVVSGNYAWNEPVPGQMMAGGAAPATPCTIPDAGGTAWKGPAPESQLLCMLDLWSTPQGFVKAAMAGNATTRTVPGGTEVSFTVAGKYKMEGLINARNELTRVRTWVPQSIIGEMLVETDYSGYRDFGGVPFPAHIVQKADGKPSLDLTVTSVKSNPPANITVPDDVRNAPPQPVNVQSLKVADGVFFLYGGSHNSMAVAMADHIVLVDTPNGEARARAVIAKAKELIPGKPLRYVVAMHHHWDHLGGIRTAIDEGATIVTHETNRALLERAAQAATSRKPLKLQTVGAEGTLGDATRTIRLYTMTNFDHTDDMLLVWLPKEKVLAEADAYSAPDTPDTPIIAPKVVYAAALYDNIQRLKLDVRTIVPFHGNRTVDMKELGRQSGRAAGR